MKILILALMFSSMNIQAKGIPDFENLAFLMQAFDDYSQQTLSSGLFSTVGADGQCGFSSIQAAINAGVDEIRVATNKVYTEKLTLIDINVNIRGGFVDCTQAINNNQSNSKSIIDHTGLNLGSIVALSGIQQRNTIILENLTLRDASSSGIEAFSADTIILLRNVLIDNNTLVPGAIAGGVGIFQGKTNLVMIDTIISNNSAEFAGGLYCSGFLSSVVMMGVSGISKNHAVGTSSSGNSGQAGGVFVTDNCAFSMYSGTAQTGPEILLGISANTANAEGGGIYIDGSSSVFLHGQGKTFDGVFFGDKTNPVNVSDNISDADLSGNEAGGGIYMNEVDARVNMNGGLIKDNIGSKAGGIYVNDGAEFSARRLKGGCWDDVRCNFFSGNIARDNNSGGALLNVQGTIDISQVYFEDNQAGTGTAIYALGASSSNRIDNSVFNHNSKPSNGLLDRYVIRASAGALVEIVHSTFADNNVQRSIFEISLDSEISIDSSIIHETSGINVFNDNHGFIDISCLITHNITDLFGVEIILTDPQFKDRNNRDYHLDASLSPAIDYCVAAPSGASFDIDNQVHGWDDPTVTNRGNNPNAVFDIGADETLNNDIIFKNGFE